MIIVRLLSPGPWLVGTTKVYPGVGADIVMESIFTDYGHPLNNQYRTPEGLGCALLLSMTGLERSIVADNYDKPIFHISPGRKLPS
jgi:hypothetical protein